MCYFYISKSLVPYKIKNLQKYSSKAFEIGIDSSCWEKLKIPLVKTGLGVQAVC